MSTNMKDGLNYILQAINNLIEPKLDKLRYDKTYRAKVIEKIEAGIYRVQINGTEYKINYSGDLNVGDIVKVKAPLNNFSDIYIETLPSSGGSGGTSNYNDLVNKPILNTNNTVKQNANNAEIIKGTINLHKISKTGDYNDLINLPSLDFIPNSQKGVANGVATLNGEQTVAKNNLPSDTVYDNNYIHTDNNFTTILKNKLNGIEAEAQVNEIETIQKNGTILNIENKTVNITVPTKTSDLSNDSNFITDKNYVHTDNNFTTSLKNKLEGIDSGAQVNVIEKIQKNGVDLSIVNKTANIIVPTKTSELSNDGEDGIGKFLTQVPIASKTTLGGFKVGSNLIITEDGTLSAIGGVGITVVDDLTSTSAIDALSANQGRILNNKIVANGDLISALQKDVISIEDNMVTNIKLNNTILPKTNKEVNIPIASKTQLGVFKVGENLTISEEGILSATGGENETELYYSEEGLGTNITLYDNPLNYDYLWVQYYTATEQPTVEGSKLIPIQVHGENVYTLNETYEGSSYSYAFNARIALTNTGVNFSSNRTIRIGNEREIIENTPIIIYKIIGFKK